MVSHAKRARTSAPSIRIRWPNLAPVLLGFSAVIAFAIALLAVALLSYGAYYRDAVYPGVSVAGQDVGGLNRAAALAIAEGRVSTYLADGVTFQAGEATWVASASDLGIRFDAENSVESAFAVGRSGNWWTDSRAWLRTLVAGYDVGYTVSVDAAAVEAFLTGIAPEITVGASNPRYQLSSSGQIEIVPGTTGVGIDAAATLRELRTTMLSMSHAPITVVTTEVAPTLDPATLEAMHPRIQAIVGEPLLIEYGGFGWQLTPATMYSLLEIDVSPDAAQSIAVDVTALERMLTMLQSDVQRTGTSASVRRNGDQFVAVPGQTGFALDVPASTVKVEEAILAGEHHVTLETTSIDAPVSLSEAERVAALANTIVTSTYELRHDGHSVSVPGSQFASALSFETNADAGTIEIVVDKVLLETLLAHAAHDVLERPVDAELRYYDGQVVVVREEQYGVMMDRNVTAQRVADALNNGETSIAMAMVPLEPDIKAAMAADVQIREMISYGETYYSGSAANRKHNVELATQRANGALVPPGGEYSFTNTIGKITLESGYQVGFGIEGTTDGNVTTVPSVGGGACQVSTTVFQAVFWAGLPIVERNWHLYWMPLYGQQPTGITGLDATIDTTWGLDFRFTNTTDDWIAIVSSANGNAVRFEVWGTKPNWHVEVDGPVVSNRVAADPTPVIEETNRLPSGTRLQVEAAQDGFDVSIVRRVFEDGELIDHIVLNSHYKPSSNRTLVGTGS